MSIALRCSCGQAFKVKDSLEGKRVACPSCKGPVAVRAGDPSVCQEHSDRGAEGTCRKCKGAFCQECLKEASGKTFCRPCLARLKAKARKKQSGERSAPGSTSSRRKKAASGRTRKPSGRSATAAATPPDSTETPSGRARASAQTARVSRNTPSGKFFNPDYAKAKQEIERSGRQINRPSLENVGLDQLSKRAPITSRKLPQQGRPATLSLAVAAGLGLLASALFGWAATQVNLFILYAFATGSMMGFVFNRLSQRTPGSKALQLGGWVGAAVGCFAVHMGIFAVLGVGILQEEVQAGRGIAIKEYKEQALLHQHYIDGKAIPPEGLQGATREQLVEQWKQRQSELSAKAAQIEAQSPEAALDEVLETRTGATGMLGFLRYYAAFGTELAEDEEGSPLFTYILWILELILLFAVPYYVVTNRW